MARQTQERLVPVGWRVPEEVRWQIKSLAAQRQTTVEDQVREALRRYIAEAERETAKVRRERARREQQREVVTR